MLWLDSQCPPEPLMLSSETDPLAPDAADYDADEDLRLLEEADWDHLQKEQLKKTTINSQTFRQTEQ